MLGTGLIIAALLASAPPQQTVPTGAPAPATTPQGQAGADRNALVCEDRPVTGRRINQRRCRTRAQADAARRDAQGLVADIQSAPAPSTEAILGGTPR